MNEKENPNEDQVQEESSEEEQTQKEPSDIEDVDDAFKKFEEKAAKKPSKTEVKAEEEPCVECDEEKEKASEANFFIVDKSGKRIPALFKADGKDYNPDTVEKIFTWANFGIHRKSESEEVEKAKPIINLILTAFKEGRLSVDGKSISKSGKEEIKEEEEEGEETIVDPEVEKLRKEVKEIKDTRMKEKVLDLYGSLTSEIKHLKNTHFAALNKQDEETPKEVWDLLGEIEGNKPKYTPEQAIKLSHESMVNFVKKLVKEHPEEFVDEDVIYAKKLKEKQDKEDAPVSPPSELPVETKPKKKDDFEGVDDAIELGLKTILSRKGAAQKL